jgi:hypothetical protein
MAHFAQIDENSIVVNVLVIPDSEESTGHEYLANDLGFGGTWIQTSYNSKIRKHFAGIGMSYNETLDAFIPVKFNCHDEEVLNEDTCLWECSNSEHKETNA